MTIVLFSQPATISGINSAIVAVLKEIRNPVPIGYLSNRVGRSKEEMNTILLKMKERNIVNLSNDMVSLTNQE